MGMSLTKETSGESPYNEISKNKSFSSAAQSVSGGKVTVVRHVQKAISILLTHPKKATSKYGA